MSTFNKKKPGIKTKNEAGGVAYKMPDELALYTHIVNTFGVKDYYYRTHEKWHKDLEKLIAKCDPELVMKMAIYAREKMYLRSMPIRVIILLIKHLHNMPDIKTKYNKKLRATVTRIIQRTDELSEMLAAYIQLNEIPKKGGAKSVHTISKVVRQGIADAFDKFDEYQLAKYRGNRNEISLRDVMFITHPKPTGKQKRLFEKITGTIPKTISIDVFDNIIDKTDEKRAHTVVSNFTRDEKNGVYVLNSGLKSNTMNTIKDVLIESGFEIGLRTPYTWETELSAIGQKYKDPEKKKQAIKEKWEELIASGKLGYMALLRNLRNILQAEVSPNHINVVCDRLADPQQVARSKQFPFRFYSAYKQVETITGFHTAQVLEAIDTALKHSVKNIKGIDIDNDRIVIACDLSGSMETKISQMSDVSLRQIGCVMGALAYENSKNTIVSAFGQTFKAGSPRRGSVINTAKTIMSYRVGHSTNGYLVLKHLIKNEIECDKLFIFTDEQMWNSTGYRNYGWFSSRKQTPDDPNDNRPFHWWWREYKKRFPNAKLYLFDLHPSNASVIPINKKGGDAYLIAGWSDKIFDTLHYMDKGEEILQAIHDIEISKDKPVTYQTVINEEKEKNA